MLLENTLFPFLAEPLPGEILSSVIIRSAEMVGKSPNVYFKSLTGKPFYNLLFYFFLDDFADLESVLNLTVYPYFFSVLKEDRREQIIGRIKNGEPVGKAFPNYALEGLRKKNLHYCVECLKEDIEKFGTGYFHLVHQYDGVTCCLKHQLKLVPCLRRTVPGPEDIAAGIPADELEIEEAKILASLPEMKFEDLQDIYNACIDIMDGVPNQNKKKVIENAGKINLNFPVTLNAERVKYLTGGNNDKAFHPYFHVAMIKALALETGSVDAVLRKPAKTCRNPRCRSDNTRLMGINLPYHNYWQCLDCGCIFSDLRISQLGKRGKKLLEEHEKESSGAYLENIAGLNVKKQTYRKLMERDPEKIDKEIRRNRDIAMKYTSRADLRREYPAAYNFLRKYDYKWLNRFFSVFFDPVRTPTDKQAQEEKDRQALEKVSEAYREAQSLNVWITSNYLKNVTGLKKCNAFMKKCYPRTLEFIESHAETCEASWIRRVKLFVDQYDFREPLTLQVLKRELGHSRFIPIAYRLMENYIREKEREARAL